MIKEWRVSRQSFTRSFQQQLYKESGAFHSYIWRAVFKTKTDPRTEPSFSELYWVKPYHIFKTDDLKYGAGVIKCMLVRLNNWNMCNAVTYLGAVGGAGVKPVRAPSKSRPQPTTLPIPQELEVLLWALFSPNFKLHWVLWESNPELNQDTDPRPQNCWPGFYQPEILDFSDPWCFFQISEPQHTKLNQDSNPRPKYI